MITLYYFPNNASFAPHVLLHELGAAFTLKKLDRENGEHQQSAYLELNPNGLIPLLVDDGLVLYETAAICLHLADTHPQLSFLPPLGTHARAQAYKWLIWSTNTLQATLIHYFYPERVVDAGNTCGALQVKALAQARIGDLLIQVDTQLASHNAAWFLGEQFSAIDPMIFMLCRWTRNFSAKPAREYPHIAPYLARFCARPSVQKAFDTEGERAPWY